MSRPLLDVHHIGLNETGNETWSRNIVEALEARHPGQFEYAVCEPGRSQVGIPTERLHVVSRQSGIRLLRDLPALTRRLHPSVLLAQFTLPPLSRVPGVLVVHDVSFVLPESRAWIPMRTLLRLRATIGVSLRRAAEVVVPTEYTRRQLLEHYPVAPEHVHVATLGLDRSLPHLPRRSRPDGPRTVLCVGTVVPRKNLPVVARAVAALRSEGEDVRLRLVGPVRPAGEADLELITRLLGDAVVVSGIVSPLALAQAYAESDVLAYPSLHEGFGLPLLEGMAAGLPVVSSNATCLPEVAGDAALLVPPDDVDGWQRALAAALDHPEPWVRAGAQRVRRFSWTETGDVVLRALAAAGQVGS